MSKLDLSRLDELIEEIELPSQYDGLPVFAVGGCVRDKIRGVSFEDIDLMVTETTPNEMRRRGFREIDSPNNDTFAVFQDSLNREVAIAREEVSTGDAHDEFDITPVPASVEAGEAAHRDLKRRDFTVNAMALDLRHGVLHDPHSGAQDLEDDVIRAVDENAFRQDPLRIIRGARFASRLDADIEPATKSLMTEMVDQLNSLPNERIRLELEKCLVQADEPSRFFEILDEIDALRTTFPELAELTHVPAGPEQHHQEGSAFRHTLMVLDEMKELRPDDELSLLMAISHDLGKSVTDEEDLPSHPAHGKHGVPIVEEMADRLSMSNEQENAMRAACRHHMKMQDIADLRESTVINLVEEQDMATISRLIDLVEADAAGRVPEGETDVGKMLARAFAAGAAIEMWTGEDLIDEGYDPDEMGGEEFGDLLLQKRVELMREIEDV